MRKKSATDLADVVHTARKTVQDERFKDKFSRKASIIRTAKLAIARALTELHDRTRNNTTT